MSNSIRFNLFKLFALMMAAFMLCGIILNVFMLEKFYIYKNKAMFKDLSHEISLVIDSNDLQETIETINQIEGIAVYIINDNLTITNSTINQSKNNKVPKEIVSLIKDNNDVYTTITKKDSIPKLVYLKQIDNKYLLMTKPMKAIQESAAIANEFYLLAGLFALILGSIFMFKYSIKVTQPIIEMKNIAYEMANLNFERKLNIKSHNELNELGNSINELSTKLEKSISDLKRDVEFQKSLARNMSHELKTPIGVIKGYSEGLLYDVVEDPQQTKKYIKTIVNECERMDDLVKEMLMLSRLSANGYQLSDVSSCDFSDIFKQILERYDHVIKSSRINFDYYIQPNVVLDGNKELLFLVLSNLLSNAIKYCDEAKDIIFTITKNDKIEINVYNSCEGIPESEQTKIFDEFYKVDRARSRESGHGLGLSIVKTIVLLHHGQISVKNINRGVCFTIIF